MDWLILIFLVPLLLIPLVFLMGFAGCEFHPVPAGGNGNGNGAEAPPAPSNLTATTFTLTASPVAGSTQAGDGDITINQSGIRTWGASTW